MHPRVASQVSAVHTAPSSPHASGRPGRQPSDMLQISIPLQTSSSSQAAGVPATQSPFEQVSSPLQMLVSRQSASTVQQPWTDVWTQPIVGSQLSVVQRAPSLQLGGKPTWQPAIGSQVSIPLHMSP